jgi:hypothetical protein
MTEKRENWGSKLGMILAMAGNAVGLGNFWRYPYQAAKNGGGAFMIPYFGALILLGIPLMLIEWNLGRQGGKYGHGTLGPMVYLQAREGMRPKGAAILASFAGMIAFGVTILVNAYYNHIIGWTLGYAYMSATGQYMDKSIDTGNFFVQYVQSPGNRRAVAHGELVYVVSVTGEVTSARTERCFWRGFSSHCDSTTRRRTLQSWPSLARHPGGRPGTDGQRGSPLRPVFQRCSSILPLSAAKQRPPRQISKGQCHREQEPPRPEALIEG